MPVSVFMPKVDMDMTHGKIAVWHVEEGSLVQKGDALFDIETDKSAMEVECPADGRIHHLRAPGEQEIAVGEAVAWIYQAQENVGKPPSQNPQIHQHVPANETGTNSNLAQKIGSGIPMLAERIVEPNRPRATPAARRMARETGTPLSTVVGSGPEGRIQAKDLKDALASGGQEPPADPNSINIVRQGSGNQTPLLLIHGLASDAQSWQPLLAAIGSKRPILRLELPGHGRSGMGNPKDFQGLAKQMTQALDRTDIESLHLIGHSLGGALALAFADVRPRKVRSLSLMSPAGLGPEIDATALFGLMRASETASLTPWLKAMVYDPTIITEGFVGAVKRSRQDLTKRQMQTELANRLFLDGVQTFDLRSALHRLVTPALIIWGKSDRIIPWRQGLQAQGSIALHFLEHTGHMPHIETPQSVAHILIRHIKAAENHAEI